MSGLQPSPGNELLIVDGYNVLHTTGILRGVGPGALEKARNILVGLVRRALPSRERRRTALVFDSRQAGLESRVIIAGIRIEFAQDHASADERIIELISRHSAPKRLTVVTSDRAICEAARSRRWRTIASEDWLEEISRAAKQQPAGRDGPTPDSPSGRDAEAVDVEWWLSEMNLAETAGEPEIGGSRIFPPDYADELFEDDPGTARE